MSLVLQNYLFLIQFNQYKIKMFKENLLTNQLQNDPFEIVYNFRAKFIRPKAKYVRKTQKNATLKVVQPPKNIDQYKNQRKMTVDSQIELEIDDNRNEPGIQQFLNELLGSKINDCAQRFDRQDFEPFFYEKQLQLAIPFCQIKEPQIQMDQCICHSKKSQTLIDEQHNQELEWNYLLKDQLNLSSRKEIQKTKMKCGSSEQQKLKAFQFML